MTATATILRDMIRELEPIDRAMAEFGRGDAARARRIEWFYEQLIVLERRIHDFDDDDDDDE